MTDPTNTLSWRLVLLFWDVSVTQNGAVRRYQWRHNWLWDRPRALCYCDCGKEWLDGDAELSCKECDRA